MSAAARVLVVFALSAGVVVLALARTPGRSGVSPPRVSRSHALHGSAVAHPGRAPRAARVARGDARRQGRSAAVGPSRPRLAWVYEAGAPITGQAVTDGRGAIYVGSQDGVLHALESDGTPRFRRAVRGPVGAPRRGPDRVWAAPAVGPEGRVYVGSDRGVLAAFESDGTPRFVRPLPGPVDTPPAIAPEGDVWVTAGRWLVALSAEGALRLRHRARGKLFGSAAIDPRGRVYVGGQDDTLRSLDARGKVRFQYTAGADVDSGPVLGDDGSVFFATDAGRVIALDSGGRQRWSRQLDGAVRAPLALGPRGQLVAATLGPRPALVGLCAVDGEVRWSIAMEVTDGPTRGLRGGALIDAHGDVYVGAHDGALHALTADGRPRFTFPTRGEVRSAPVLLADGTLIFGSDDGRLYALRDTP